MATIERRTTVNYRMKLAGDARDMDRKQEILSLGVFLGREVEKSPDPGAAKFEVVYDPNYLHDFVVASIVTEPTSVGVLGIDGEIREPEEAFKPRPIRDAPQA